MTATYRFCEKKEKSLMPSMKIILSLVLLAFSSVALAQSTQFSKQGFEYTFDLPSPAWRDVSDTDDTNRPAEFVYGDRLDGYLRVRKELVQAGTTLPDLVRRDQELKLRFLPGYVEGKQEPFTGRYKGLTASYEFTSGGKPMIGRIYYLPIDSRNVYTLHFTGLRDKLQRIRNQTDLISRSFQVK